MDLILAAELAALEQADLRRRLRIPDAGLLNFAANDYLGLARHPALIQAQQESAARHGAGAGASRLITGTNAAVTALEERLAAWKEKAAALVFSSGYAAALGTIPALVRKDDVVVLDKLAHASLIDGAKLSGATLQIYPHNHLNRLEAILRQVSGKSARVLIVTESIFSMDGDTAPLAEICALKNRYGAWLLVDEAHATGLYGPTGAGVISHLGLSDQVEVIMGTFSKALGSLGGYIVGSRTLIDWLINRGRSLVYSTALPPGVIAASAAAVELASGAEGTGLRSRLRENTARFQAGLPARWQQQDNDLGRVIYPLICGEAATALNFSARLQEHGFLIPAIRYPTVPRGQARLRLTLSAGHRPEQVDQLLQALAKITASSS